MSKKDNSYIREFWTPQDCIIDIPVDYRGYPEVVRQNTKGWVVLNKKGSEVIVQGPADNEGYAWTPATRLES